MKCNRRNVARGGGLPAASVVIGLAVLSTGSIAQLLAVAEAADAVSAETYGLSVGHRMLDAVELDDGFTGLELALTVHNGGERDLYDVRLFLDRLDAGGVVAHSPARVNLLPAAGTENLSWTFEGVLAPPELLTEGTLGLRVEAIDASTQEIVTFTLDSGAN